VCTTISFLSSLQDQLYIIYNLFCYQFKYRKVKLNRKGKKRLQTLIIFFFQLEGGYSSWSWTSSSLFILWIVHLWIVHLWIAKD